MRVFFYKQKLVALAALSACLGSLMATDYQYINSGSVTTPINIDATNFINEGTFNIGTSLAYETANTLYYTNRGTMDGSVGFRVEFAPTSGARRRSGTFANEGKMRASESTVIFSGNFSLLSYLTVNATNVYNPGSLSVGPSGLLQVKGNNLNLRNGSMLAGTDISQGTFFTSFDSFNSTNYFNENNIIDLYWGVGTNGAISGESSPLFLGSGQFDLPSPNSGPHEIIENFFGFNSTNSVTVPGGYSFFFSTNFGTSDLFKPFVYSSSLVGTSRIVQVIFVSTNASDTNMTVDVRFVQNGAPNRGRQAIVQFGVVDSDVISGLQMTNFVYFSDSSAPATFGTNQLALQKNRNVQTSRPNVYDLTLYTPTQWSSGQPTNTPYSSNLIYNSSYQYNQVSNLYSGYSVSIGASQTTNIYGGTGVNAAQADPTNSLGRIEIIGGLVDLNGARIRSSGLLTIQSDNFQPVTQGAKLDAQQIKLDLTSTNRSLIISNMLSGSVRRISGNLNAWSGIWTNNTATEEIKFHVMVLENNLSSVQTTTAYGFTARTTNQPAGQGSVVLVDNLTVDKSFLIDSDAFVNKGFLTMPADIGATNFPRLMYFTNEGTIFSPGLARISPQVSSLSAFVNTGLVYSVGQVVNTAYFQNSGYLQSSQGSITISNTPGIANLNNGQIFSAIDFTLLTDELQSSNSYLKAGNIITNFSTGLPEYNLGSLNFTVGSRLVETGFNRWDTLNGFKFNRKNISVDWTGDLLQTVIYSTAKPFSVVPHIWSGVDRGANNAGFLNNAALGGLVLDGTTSSQFRFSAQTAGVTNAIYVDYLEFRNTATNYATSLSIDPNFRIYFADSNIPAEKLNGAQDGRLIWVKTYAGLNSGTNIVSNGKTNYVNRALAASKEIDSDGDGVPNLTDPSPFDGPTLAIAREPNSVVLSWTAAANTLYNIDYTENLSTNTATWLPLTNITTGSFGGSTNIHDSVTGTNLMRYYRVRYAP